VAVPALTAVTTPEAETVAMAELLLVHVPPVVALAKVTAEPMQVPEAPVIAATTGNALTVTRVVSIAVPQDEVIV